MEFYYIFVIIFQILLYVHFSIVNVDNAGKIIAQLKLCMQKCYQDSVTEDYVCTGVYLCFYNVFISFVRFSRKHNKGKLKEMGTGNLCKHI